MQWVQSDVIMNTSLLYLDIKQIQQISKAAVCSFSPKYMLYFEKNCKQPLLKFAEFAWYLGTAMMYLELHHTVLTAQKNEVFH